ncbi:hypothetical protein PVAND_005650 [Polypedilum vanderplanki]|uniref:SHSP domain-containing protein n=1 Tax=Polypedilum vanderplanki TaxID=319348 RepID=A0A9J6C1K9_POLVA|nr:hypothetical protein PVAND_005650 [Polypedilum vanderplanki]
MALLPVLLDLVDDLYENLENPSRNEIPLLYLPQRSVQGGCPRMTRRHCPRGDAKECPAKADMEKKEEIKENQQSVPSEGCPKACTRGQCQKTGKCQREGMKQKDWNALAFYDHPLARQFPWELLRHCQNQRECPVKTPEDFEVILNVKSFKPEDISVKVKGREIIIEGKHEERQEDNGFVSRQFTRRYVLGEEFDIDTVTSYLSADGQMIIRALKPKPVSQTTERIIPIERVASTPQPKKDDENKGESSSAITEEKKAADFEIVDNVEKKE